MLGNNSDNLQLPEARDVLERFVFDNEELRRLEDLIGGFNIFDALGIAEAEIRHSNFLAWVLENRLMDTDDVLKLCELIYKKHRQAIDLIDQYRPSPDGGLLERIELELKSDPRWHVWGRSRYWVYFAPKDWLSQLPAIGDGQNVQAGEWLYFFLEALDGKFAVYGGPPCNDAHLRTRIIEKLRDDMACSCVANEVLSGRDCIWTFLMEWGPDDLPDEDKAIALVKAEPDTIYAKFSDLPLFVRAIQ